MKGGFLHKPKEKVKVNGKSPYLYADFDSEGVKFIINTEEKDTDLKSPDFKDYISALIEFPSVFLPLSDLRLSIFDDKSREVNFFEIEFSIERFAVTRFFLLTFDYILKTELSDIFISLYTKPTSRFEDSKKRFFYHGYIRFKKTGFNLENTVKLLEDLYKKGKNQTGIEFYGFKESFD